MQHSRVQAPHSGPPGPCNLQRLPPSRPRRHCTLDRPFRLQTRSGRLWTYHTIDHAVNEFVLYCGYSFPNLHSKWRPGWCSHYSGSLQAERFGDRNVVGLGYPQGPPILLHSEYLVSFPRGKVAHLKFLPVGDYAEAVLNLQMFIPPWPSHNVRR